MPRINIEERWFTDPRRDGLIKHFRSDVHLADGFFLNVLKLAQHYWIPDMKNVPKNIWHAQGLGNILFELDLAIVESDGGIYLRGLKNTYEWWFLLRKKGKKGGRPKTPGLAGANPGVSQGLAGAKPQDSQGLAGANPQDSQGKPLILSCPILSNPVLSDPVLSEGQNPIDSVETASGSTQTASGSTKINKIGIFLAAFREASKKNLRRDMLAPTKKQLGVIKRITENLTIEQIQYFAEKYTQWRDPYITKRGHPIELLETNFEQLHAWASSINGHRMNLVESEVQKDDIERQISKEKSYAQLSKLYARPNSGHNNGIRDQVPREDLRGLSTSGGQRDERPEYTDDPSSDDFSEGPVEF